MPLCRERSDASCPASAGSRPASHDFVPALGVHALTPLYDIAAWIAGERRIKRRLLDGAGITSGADVLDLGCGTGTLAIMAAERAPSAHVVGLDVDPRHPRHRAPQGDACRRGGGAGRGLGHRSAIRRRVVRSRADDARPPSPDDAAEAPHPAPPPAGSFVRAASCTSRTSAGRTRRSCGSLSHTFHLFDGDETTGANLRGELPGLVREAGFDEVEETEHWSTPFGTLTFLRAAAGSS